MWKCRNAEIQKYRNRKIESINRKIESKNKKMESLKIENIQWLQRGISEIKNR